MTENRRRRKSASRKEMIHRLREALAKRPPVPGQGMFARGPLPWDTSKPIDLSGLEGTGIHLFDKDTPTEDIVRMLRERAEASKRDGDDTTS